MKFLSSLFILCILAVSAHATLPLSVSMLDVVSASDHILTVNIVGVEMRDGDNDIVTDLTAMTGPGKDNTIYLKAEPVKVHVSTHCVPQELEIPLDRMMHYSLKQVKQVHAKNNFPLLVVLKGDNFTTAYDGIFNFPDYELKTLLKLYEITHPKKQIEDRCNNDAGGDK